MPNIHPISRWKAAGLHLLISVFVAILAGSLIYFVWYPPPYFKVAGGNNLMLLIMGVDVVVGPLLTLTIFKAGKKGLRFDLTVIALLQITAFCYGLRVIALARPVFVVAAVDRFVLLPPMTLTTKIWLRAANLSSRRDHGRDLAWLERYRRKKVMRDLIR